MSNYVPNYEVKNVTRVHTSDLAKKADLTSLKFEEDKLNVDKLETFPVDLSKLNDAVKKMLLKRLYMVNWLKNLILLLPLILTNELKKTE